MQRVEVQNEGPGVVTVTFRMETRGEKPETVKVEVPEGGAEIESLWYGGPPDKLEVEAKWASTVRRQTFLASSLGDDWQRTTSSGVIHGLAVSPVRFQWRQPSPWVRMQNPALIPLGLFVGVLAVSVWFRLRKGGRSAVGGPT